MTYREDDKVDDQGSVWTLPVSMIVFLALIIVAVFYIMYTIRSGQPNGDVGEAREDPNDPMTSGSDEHSEKDLNRRS